MAAQIAMTVYDGAATPVAHTFQPIGNSKSQDLSEEIAEWREAVTTIPLYAQGMVKTSIKTLKSGVKRVTLTVMFPVMESISGQNAAGYTAAPKVAYTNTVQIVGYFHERSTMLDRRIPLQVLANLVNNTGASITPATSGFTYDLFGLVTSPA